MRINDHSSRILLKSCRAPSPGRSVEPAARHSSSGKIVLEGRHLGHSCHWEGARRAAGFV